MLGSNLFFSLLVLSAFLVPVNAQDQSKFLVWSDSPACGSTNLSPNSGPIQCARTMNKGKEAYSFRHGKMTLAVEYWWYASHVRVLAKIANEGDSVIPVGVKSWSVTGYESLAAVRKNARPLFISDAENPAERIGLETGAGESIAYDDSGRGRTKGVGEGARVPKTPAEFPGSARASAMKWTEIPSRSKLEGQVRFDVKPKARYLRLSININGINYIYSLERLKR